MHRYEAVQLSADLATLRQIVGTNAKKELVEETWRSVLHTEFIDLVGNNKRQWFTTWDSILAEPKASGADLDLDDVLYEAENRIATPTQTAQRFKAKLGEGWPENVLKAIVDKTLDAGVTAEVVRKLIGGSAVFKCALAADWLDMSEEKRARLLREHRYASTPKMDGLRCLFRVNMPNPGAFSREFKPLKNLEAKHRQLSEWFSGAPGIVDGEILASDWNDTVTGVKKSGSKVHTKFYAFDFIPAEEVSTLRFRLTSDERNKVLNTHLRYGDESEFVQVMRHRVENPQQAEDEMRRNLDDEWEGSVLHDLDAPYTTKRTNAWIKLKVFFSTELTVTNFLPGTGKHLGRLGAIVVEGAYQGARIRTEVGTGFSDAERSEMWTNQKKYLGRSAEIKFFSTTAAGALRFPSFLRMRPKGT